MTKKRGERELFNWHARSAGTARTLGLLAGAARRGVDDVDAGLGAAAGGEGDADEPPLRPLFGHGHGSSFSSNDTVSVKSRQQQQLLTS
jgi:hypothetical protein